MSSIKTLHEVCEEIGVTRRAIQGYEKLGLVRATARNKYGHLLYDEQAQRRMSLIKDYQRLGFKLKDINDLIDAPDAVVRDALEKQLVVLQEHRRETDILIDMAKRWICEISDEV